MIITTAIRTRAILDVFIRNDLSSGDTLLLSALRGSWSDVGLRHDDLVEGLRDLVFRNFVQVEYDNSQFSLRLTADGYDHCLRRPSDRNAIYAVLERARRRAAANSPEAPPEQKRRYVDRQLAGDGA